jgi:hypothetical protein
MNRNRRWSITDNSQASLTRAVDERGAPSIIDIKPMASFSLQTSTTVSPIIISMIPDCTMYIHDPGSPLLNTRLPLG